MSEQGVDKDALGTFLHFADAIQANAERAHRPAYAETCTCGATVEIGQSVPAAERRRMYANFFGRHNDCASVPPPGNGGTS